MTISNDQFLQSLRWEFHHFDSLDTRSLFALMKLRVDVFVVEQKCPYPELDEFDTAAQTVHLLGFVGDELAAYARAMPQNRAASNHPEVTPAMARPDSPTIRIGRVVVASAYRSRGLASTLMQHLMSHLHQQYPARSHCLAAQDNVRHFYSALGFVAVSDVYLEDDIPHVDMVRHVGPVDERKRDSAIPAMMRPNAK